MSGTTKGAMLASMGGCVVAPVVRLLDPATEEDEMFVRREFVTASGVGALVTLPVSAISLTRQGR